VAPPEEDVPPDVDEPEPVGEKLRRLALRFLVVAGVAGVGFALAPDRMPVKRDPGFIDIIFASRTVVGMVRALLLFASIYVALSLIALIWNSRWITSFAGVQTGKVEPAVSGLAQERDRLARELEESANTMRALEEDLQEALDLIDHLSVDLDKPRSWGGDLHGAGRHPLEWWRRWRR
jgi:hypothetical protein